ncbi:MULTISPECIES: hypothetical protein [unclassified Sphingobium]|uniref:hypothetical protein n=1 Tax=unclassified Sphingobium TaxID=2611147 RepID=UPI0039189FE1
MPSRLVGRRLNAHLFDDRIELFLGPDRVMSTPRVRISHPHRGHSIDFRHMIGKPRTDTSSTRLSIPNASAAQYRCGCAGFRPREDRRSDRHARRYDQARPQNGGVNLI